MVNLYGGDHKSTRRAMLPYAVGSPCARCGRPIQPGQAVDLDHLEDETRAFSHAYCNRAAGGRVGAARRVAYRDARKERIKKMTTDVVLGVEIAEDRRHTSIVTAGNVDGIVLVDLVAYLDGVTTAVDAVTALHTERAAVAVVIDPHSPGATLIRPLTEAGVAVTQPSTSDTVVAHGRFLDLLAAGGLRHTGRPELDTAVRHGTQRPLGGANTWARRGASVDVGPLLAAQLAVWGLLSVPPPVEAWVMYR